MPREYSAKLAPRGHLKWFDIMEALQIYQIKIKHVYNIISFSKAKMHKITYNLVDNYRALIIHL